MTDTTARPAAIERTLELAAPRARVWRAISDPVELARWFPDRAAWELTAGAAGTFVWDEYGSYAVRIEAVEEPRYLAWRWADQADVSLEAASEPTLVEWWLDERPDGGTTLRVRESGFTTRQHRDGNDRGWTAELAELVELLGEAPQTG